MTKKKTEQDYIDLARCRGFRFCGPLPKNTQTKTTWECGLGHRWSAQYGNISFGSGCPYCSGKARKTQGDYHNLAQSRGFAWVGGKLPIATREKTTWACRHGHEWETTYAHIRSGNGCSVCSNHTRINIDKYHDLAKRAGFLFVGKLPQSVDHTTLWKCENGHEFRSRYSDIKQGIGCPHCSGKARKTESDYRDMAKSRGFKWVGKFPRNVNSQTEWECGSGHRWLATYANIYVGNGCMQCSGKARKTQGDYHNLAQSRGFAWAGNTVPKNSITKTRWKCQNSHVWRTSYSSIQSGNGCPYCSGTIKKEENDYRTLAEKRGFKWVGPLPGRVLDKSVWECENGHRWSTIYASIQQGHGCPHCKASNGEKKVASVLEDLHIAYTAEKRFKSCRDKRPLPFDFFFAYCGVSLLIEYHGEQHYSTVNNEFFGGEPALKDRKRRDKIKVDWAKKNGYPLLIIPYTKFDRIRTEVVTFIAANVPSITYSDVVRGKRRHSSAGDSVFGSVDSFIKNAAHFVQRSLLD